MFFFFFSISSFSLNQIGSLTIAAVFLFRLVTATDSLAPWQSLGDGNTLVSKDGTFELGFFSPGISKNRYLGIWYKNVQEPTYVWVGNRNNPIHDSSGILIVDNTTGDVTLLSHINTIVIVWSARLSRSKLSNPKLQLLETGNLVMKDENSEEYLWQSFDYPTDTVLPGMKLGWDLKNKIEKRLTAWKNPNDPSTGDLTWKLEHLQFPEPIIWKGSKEYVRFGPWNGFRFNIIPVTNSSLEPKFTINEEEISCQYSVVDKSMTAMVKLDQATNTLYLYSKPAISKGNWNLLSVVPKDYCDNYGLCGPYEYCSIRQSPVCVCLKGFKPKELGCERNKPLKCSDQDGFQIFNHMKLPDTRQSWANRSMNLGECREICLRNCSCTAFANTDITGTGSGCAIWIGDLIDLKFVPDGGQDLYVRLLASELTTEKSEFKEVSKKLRPQVKIVLVGISVGLVLIFLVTGFYVYRKRSNYKDNGEKIDLEDLELPIVELNLINNATNNFSLDNKLGEGGFGQVYKGKLSNGEDIAVKRLSRSSEQGMDEFKNEVILIAKLQHRNLVKLLGCCIQGEEKLLIYEYMPNKSLDFFIFDKTRRRSLDWSIRYDIIIGIARGLVYLHQDSRLRIIHRDLKASNVLLDAEMSPKISDFGLAKTFFGDQKEGNTKRIAGTYGYMAPEYAFQGKFSIKSDVFSYGVLLLEIISGKRSSGFCDGNDHDIIGYAWRLWKDGNPEELIDETIRESCNFSEVLRCIHISLLCIQQHPNSRPTMSSVVMMMNSENSLPQPKQPSFFCGDEAIIMDCDSNKDKKSNSINDLTITLPNPR